MTDTVKKPRKSDIEVKNIAHQQEELEKEMEAATENFKTFKQLRRRISRI